MTHEMQGPQIMNQMQDYFKKNPEQFSQFQKMQMQFQENEREKKRSELSANQRLRDAIKAKSSMHNSKHKHEFYLKKNEEKEEKEQQAQKELKEKKEEQEQNKKLKRQKKYAKQKAKKEAIKDFEVIENVG